MLCLGVAVFLQAEEGVAEEEVFSEGWHAHHLSCNGERQTYHTHTRAYTNTHTLMEARSEATSGMKEAV